MGNGINSFFSVQRIGKPDGGSSNGDAEGCGWMFFLAPVASPVCHPLYSDILDVGSCFLKKFHQGFAF